MKPHGRWSSPTIASRADDSCSDSKSPDQESSDDLHPVSKLGFFRHERWLALAGFASPGYAAMTPAPGAPDLEAEVQASIDNLANRVEATERIMALGERAIAPLRRYLRKGAQVIPQGRLFAVAMLARLQSPMAREGLRGILHDTRWSQLPASWREAEYQVKDVVIRHLITRDYVERFADATYATCVERLPSAVAAVGPLGLSSLAPELVDMLKDDVLERAAAASLEGLGEHGQAVVLQALPVLFEEASLHVHSRLAVIRALLVLQRTHACVPPWVLNRALADSHPAIRAAAALFDDTQDDIHRVELTRGALSDCVSLAALCRERLAHHGPEFADAAREVLHRNAEPDIYGNVHPLPRDAVRWLTVKMAEVGAGSV